MQHDPLRSFNHVSFAGVPMAQYFCDLYLWEAILNEVPGAWLVVELGSYQGGFSLYLQSQCDAREMVFRCYDVIEPMRPVHGFQKGDIFRDKDEINELLRRHEKPVVLFCDNGNKPRELQEFSADLPTGSLVVVHDWLSEAFPKDVPPWLEETMGEFCDELGSISRVFKAKEAA